MSTTIQHLRCFNYLKCIKWNQWKAHSNVTFGRGFRSRPPQVNKSSPLVENANRNWRLLTKPAIFAISVSGISYAGAAIWQYESLRSVVQEMKDKAQGLRKQFAPKAGGVRQQLNTFWNRLNDGQKVATCLVALNAAVFILWKVPVLTRTMLTYFAASPVSAAPCSSLLLSMFSHHSGVHLFFNMYVLWSFAPFVVATLGKEQFLATYISAGLFSGCASYLFKVARYSLVPSVGASGAIMAMIAVVGSKDPNAGLSIAFLDQLYPHSFTAATGIKGLMAIDLCGVIFGWKKMDHAAHLGGMLFGLWYMNYGKYYIWTNRQTFLEKWHSIRGNPR